MYLTSLSNLCLSFYVPPFLPRPPHHLLLSSHLFHFSFSSLPSPLVSTSSTFTFYSRLSCLFPLHTSLLIYLPHLFPFLLSPFIFPSFISLPFPSPSSCLLSSFLLLLPFLSFPSHTFFHFFPRYKFLLLLFIPSHFPPSPLPSYPLPLSLLFPFPSLPSQALRHSFTWPPATRAARNA